MAQQGWAGGGRVDVEGPGQGDGVWGWQGERRDSGRPGGEGMTAGSRVGLWRWDGRTGSYRSSCLQQAGPCAALSRGLGSWWGK